MSASVASFAVLAVLGSRLATGEPAAALRLVAVGVLAFLVAHEIRSLRRRRALALGLRRQTQKRLEVLGQEDVVSALWGFDAGTGFSTYRMTNGWWALALLVLAGQVPALPIAIAYGLVFCVGVGWNLYWLADDDDAGWRRLEALQQRVRLSSVRGLAVVLQALLVLCAGMVLISGGVS